MIEEDYYHDIMNIDLDILIRKYKDGKWCIMCSKSGKGHFYEVTGTSFAKCIELMMTFEQDEKLELGKNEQYLTFGLDMEE